MYRKWSYHWTDTKFNIFPDNIFICKGRISYGWRKYHLDWESIISIGSVSSGWGKYYLYHLNGENLNGNVSSWKEAYHLDEDGEYHVNRWGDYYLDGDSII
jgi:hypothetical protein